MNTERQGKYLVAIIGAGPAGLFAARHLASEGIHAVILNRDIKPGGLAEYGIYPTKYKMKAGLRKQFLQILQNPLVDYYGNVTIGQTADINLDEIKRMGFQAILVTAGAQGTRWLGLPGEDTPKGVYHAKDIVYHYNDLPPYSTLEYKIGRRAALIGVGNVSMDIARYLIRTRQLDEVIAVARRGPAEVKFTKKEMEDIIANLDLDALDTEIALAKPLMESLGQDHSAAKEFILAALPKAKEPVSNTRFRFDFLASPKRILSDQASQVCGLEVEETTLVPRDGDTKAKGTGKLRVLEVDTVIFCIGDKVDEQFGLPVQWNEFVKNTNPSYPVDDISFEVFDPDADRPIETVFVAGWSREASSGLVGVARKDGERGAIAVSQYLQTLQPLDDRNIVLDILQDKLYQIGKPVVKKEDIDRLVAEEKSEAERRGLEDFKFSTNEEMLEVIGLSPALA